MVLAAQLILSGPPNLRFLSYIFKIDDNFIHAKIKVIPIIQGIEIISVVACLQFIFLF